MSGGIRVKPRGLVKGVKGTTITAATTSAVAVRSLQLRRLRKTGLRVRMTKTTRAAEITDSVNHPVRNSALFA